MWSTEVLIERLWGLTGRHDLSPGWSGDFRIRPGHILWDVKEAYQPLVVIDRVTRRSPPSRR
jgi:hypothetical protein